MDRKRKSFVLDTAHNNAILHLSMKERGMLLTLIYSYAAMDEIDEFMKTTHSVDIIFSVIRAQLDRQFEKKRKNNT